MVGFFNELFDFERYMPHGYCFLWMPSILWLNVIGDTITALAYYSIPLTIAYLIYKRKKSLPFKWVFVMFAVFIFLCGSTHVMEVVVIWYPMYFFAGVLKIITAVVSIATAILLFPLIPKLIHIFEDFPDFTERGGKK